MITSTISWDEQKIRILENYYNSNLCQKYGFCPPAESIDISKIRYDVNKASLDNLIDVWAMTFIEKLKEEELENIDSSLGFIDYSSYIKKQIPWMKKIRNFLELQNGGNIDESSFIDFYQRNKESQKSRIMYSLMMPEETCLNLESKRSSLEDTVRFFREVEENTEKNMRGKFTRVPYLEMIHNNTCNNIMKKNKDNSFDEKIMLLWGVYSCGAKFNYGD